jgi:hypothetical protein
MLPHNGEIIKMPVFYDCETCADKPHFDRRNDMLKHLIEKHGAKMGETTFTRKPLIFLDGQGWQQQTHELDFGTFKISETWKSK